MQTTNSLTEVRRPPGRNCSKPSAARSRVAFSPDRASSQQRGQIRAPREVLADKNVPVHGAISRSRRRARARILVAFWSADGTHDVSGAVAEETHDAQRSTPPEIERKDGEQLTAWITAADREQLATSAEVLPPRRRKLPCRKDVLCMFGQGRPFFAQRLESIDQLEANGHGQRARNSR